jgi:ankyrin repeat protein
MSAHCAATEAVAIESGDYKTIQTLIDTKVIDVNVTRFCYTDAPSLVYAPILVYAVRHNQLAIVELLLRAGADIDKTDDFNRTACHLAAQFSNNVGDGDDCNMLSLLLHHKPNLGLKDYWGHTAFERSLSDKNYRAAELLIKAGTSLDGFNLSYLAAISTGITRALIGRGIVVKELVNVFGRTPLHEAACNGLRDTSVLDMLVDTCGISLDARDLQEFTSVHLAAQYKNASTLRWLISAGADICYANNLNSICPLHCVADYQCAILLLAAGADAHARTAFGSTAFEMFAAGGGDVRVFHAFLSASAHHISKYNTWLDGIEIARRDISKTRLDFVRQRALQVCVGLQSLNLPALLACEILLFACGPVAPVVAFHHWWQIATIVKHYHKSI